MKHAGPVALQQLERLLADLRKRPVLNERSLGIFYWKSRAFLHFHEDPKGLFADLKVGEGFVRFPVRERSDQERLIAEVDAVLAAAARPS